MAAVESVWVKGRRALARAAAQRASRLEGRAPRAAGRWLAIACRLAPRFDFVHRDLCAHHRRQNDRLAALAAARAAARRFDKSADAWILLAEAYVGAFRPRDALAAYEAALAIEERADAAMTAGELYLREGDFVNAGARFARAYAAGGGPKALKANAEALEAAGDAAAAAQARTMWERETGKKWQDGQDGQDGQLGRRA
jgi:tetratricopeptide (TPR) repeat protein